MKSLERVPPRYRALLEYLFDHYVEAVRHVKHDRDGAVVLTVELDGGDTITWHFLTEGHRELVEGEPGNEQPRVLHVRVSAERLQTAMQSAKSLREVAFESRAQVHGDIDFAFKVLAIAERIHARADNRGA